MTIQTLTPAEVKDLHARALENKTPGYDVRQGLRSLVKEQLNARNPVPFGFESLTPDMQAAVMRRAPLTYAEQAAHLAHQIGQMSDEHHQSYGRAKASGHQDAVGCKDAHHYHQKLHGIGLWQEADRLVAAEMGGGS